MEVQINRSVILAYNIRKISNIGLLDTLTEWKDQMPLPYVFACIHNAMLNEVLDGHPVLAKQSSPPIGLD